MVKLTQILNMQIDLRTALLSIVTALAPTSFLAAIFKVSATVDRAQTSPKPLEGLVYPLSFKGKTYFTNATDHGTLYLLTAITVISTLSFIAAAAYWRKYDDESYFVFNKSFFVLVILFSISYYLFLP
jgi:hypothetical protein